MKSIEVFVTLILVISVSEGRLRCWTCENVISNIACQQKGHLEECLVNQFHCQNEVRAIAGGMFFQITKRCKQDYGCDNNEMQNFTGVYPFQCESELPHSVCRCCCGFNNCNGPEINCIHERPVCDDPEKPVNGHVSCGTNLGVGSTCYYKCSPGFVLEGNTSTTCELNNDGTPEWSHPPPTCEVAQCEPPMEAPEHGTVVCSDGENVGSVCDFACDLPYVIMGRNRVICSHLGKWSDDPPKCVILSCPKPKPDDEHRTETCTDEYNLFSVCSYECDSAYDLEFSEPLECEYRYNRAVWDKNAPRCIIGKCKEDLTDVADCTNKNVVGSECSYRCKKGEYMVIGYDNRVVLAGVIVRVCSTDRIWTGEAPRCLPVTCEPPSTDPENGAHSCKPPGNEYGTECTFTCDRGYKLVGPPSRKCLDDGDKDPRGRWSGPQPICEIQKCPNFQSKDTLIDCTNEQYVGSECTFTCKPGEYMVDSDGTLIPSGQKVLECSVETFWSSGEPACRTKTCVPPVTPPDNGKVTCTAGVQVGSICTFECDEDYELVGSANTECLDDNDYDPNGGWSDGTTRVCRAKKCEEISVPGVTVTCTNGVLIGSVCTLKCDDKSTSLEGDSEYECIRDYDPDAPPVWNKDVNAICISILCPDFPKEGEGPHAEAGSIECRPLSNRVPLGWKINTQCDIRCNEGYKAKDNVDKTTCVAENTWSVPDLCCVRCLVNSDLDIVVLLDTTETVDYADLWAIKTNLLVDFLHYLVTEPNFDLNVTFIPFASDVDLANSIDFLHIGGDDPAERIRNELNDMPVAGRGASNSGKALQYVEEKIFDGFSEFRVPMIFLWTARAPSDEKLALSTSKILMDRNIHLRIFPIVDEYVADPGTAKDVFDKMTDHPAHVIEESGSMDFFDTASLRMSQVTEALCNALQQDNAPCETESTYI